jgi:hypothetical protein
MAGGNVFIGRYAGAGSADIMSALGCYGIEAI